MAGLLVATLAFGMVIPAMAATIKQLNASYGGIKISLDGVEFVPKDVNGNVVEPFTVDGTTYLPVRAVANAFGLEVGWDQETQTVILMTPGKQTTPEIPEDNFNGEKHIITKGEVFQKGSYINVSNVEILFNGETFEVTNNRSDIIRITVQIVGVKADGSYEMLQTPAFSGVDKTKYEKDMRENGWAIESHTNMVRPGETLDATMSVFDFSVFSEGYPDADIDGDGYYDLTFTISPQTNESTISASTDDPVSDVYKIKAE